ncbi:DUF4364 family protein [Ethanoligenens harbinense]|nr:DUF4364 domain-containing protein [Ethanoligenens harbinense YUAN-3]AYF37499.1 DUF4364 domain-containing protein [Ethanoligenens harbinense]AYF40219.1 DUF4364 domain-containing protein [Ethanoligenens harbinense]QCN91055.1 DUF4364 family protein [Ethanoligenens harbinense]
MIVENGAFGGGVDPGGLRDADDVKILICYLLKNLKQPLPLQTLAEALQQDGLVNYFTLADALHALLLSGHVDQVEQDGEKAYKATRLGAGTADMFERRLPLSVREKAVRAGVRLLARQKRDAENKVEITPSGAGFAVRCTVLDGEDTLLSISLLVPDRAQAEAVRQQFLHDPATVYRGAVALMTGDIDAVGGMLPRKPPVE